MNTISIKIITSETPTYNEVATLSDKIFGQSKELKFLSEDSEENKNHILVAAFEGEEVVTTALLVLGCTKI